MEELNPIPYKLNLSESHPVKEESSNFSAPMPKNNQTSEEKRSPLKNVTPSIPKEKEASTFIQLDAQLRGLSSTQRSQIQGECLEGYAKSVLACEKIVSELAAQHSDSQHFSKEMCRRLFAVAKAYSVVMEEREPSHSNFLKELKSRTRPHSNFVNDHLHPGSVGYNPIAIENVVENGNLREQMTLVYSGIWTLLPIIFENPEIVTEVNKKLEADGFQLNVDLINEDRSKLNYFPAALPVTHFRKTGGRIPNTNPPESKPKVREISDLSLREARTTLQDFIPKEKFEDAGERRVQWVRGKDLFKVNKDSDFYQHAVAVGQLPIVTGPSGTADGLLYGCKYLGMAGEVEQGLLAMTAWMVRVGDHSLHEIRTAGSFHGIPYEEGPRAFENIYSADPHFTENLRSALQRENLELPGYYLSPEYQTVIAKRHRFI